LFLETAVSVAADLTEFIRPSQRPVQEESPVRSGDVPAFVMWTGPIAIWGILRILLFEGIQGADDLEHLTYAWELNRIPANHWELRLPYNLLLALSLRCFGFSEFSAAFPSLMGSFMTMVFCGITVRHFTHSNRCMMLAMYVVAVLPADVLESTTGGSTRILGTGLLSMALWCLLAVKSRWGIIVSGILFGLAVDCHETLLFFVVIFFAATAVLEKELRPRLIMSWITGAVCFTLADPVLWWWFTGDPLYRLHIIEQTHLNNLALDTNARYLLDAQGHIIPGFFIRPVQEFLISKHYSVLPLLMVVVGWMTFQRNSNLSRAVLVGGLCYWLYMAFGTHTPSGYKPIPGTVNYWQPLAIPLSIILGSSLPMIRPKALQQLAMAMIVLPCLFFMSISGSWGQNVDVARLFLDITKEAPDCIFIADDRTGRAMYVLNGFQPPANVRLVPHSKRADEWHIQSWNSDHENGQNVYVMLNWLNDPENTVAGHSIPDNAFSFRWLTQHAGEHAYRTSVGYRPIAFLLPAAAQTNWMIRRPASDIRCYLQEPEPVASMNP